MAKIATIKNFSGMKDNGMFWVEGMSARKVNGQSVLTPSWKPNYVLSEETSGFSDMSTIDAFTNIDYSSATALKNHILGIDAGEIFDFHINNSSYYKGEIHAVGVTGSGTDQIIQNNNPDLRITNDGNILYPSSNHLGVGWVKTATGGSATSLVVDGVDFTTLGVSTSAGSNKLFDLTLKEEFTITSITTTGGTSNDTLNFSAGTGTPSTGDIFAVFVDNRFKFGTTISSGNHFKIQEASTQWVRQIKEAGDYYWALNGNYLSRLAKDESTWTSDILVEEHKQFPVNTQGVCMDNNQDRLLIGCDFNGKGRLLLTDYWGDGWLSILEIDRPPEAIRAYEGGWIVLIGGGLFYTDGYFKPRKLEQIPDTNDYRTSVEYHYNGLDIVGDSIIVNVDSSDLNRCKTGTYILEPSGWSFVRPATSSTLAATTDAGFAGAVYVARGLTSPDYRIYTSFSLSSQNTNANVINYITQGGGQNYSTIIFSKLNKKNLVGEIVLNLATKHEDVLTNTGDIDVTVNVGTAKKAFWKSTTAGTGSLAGAIANTSGGTASKAGSVGDQIQMLEGATAGERSYITAIADPGTASEVWTILPALSTAPANNDAIQMLNLKKTLTKTITSTDIEEELSFPVDVGLTDNLFIEVVFKGTNANLINLNAIDIYATN